MGEAGGDLESTVSALPGKENVSGGKEVKSMERRELREGQNGAWTFEFGCSGRCPCTLEVVAVEWEPS